MILPSEVASKKQSLKTAEVVVIGAGPVGLTLANELKRRGILVVVVEKLPAIREVSKACIWHVRTQEALGKVGIMKRGVQEALPMTEVVVHAYGKHVGSWNMDGIDSPFKHPLIIGQNRTQHLLVDLLEERGAKVEWNTEATQMEILDDGINLKLITADPTTIEKSEKNIRASFVVGCEGSRSLVRNALGLTFKGERYSGEQFIQADCKISWNLPRGRSYLFLTPEGYMMAIELPGGIHRIFISLPDAAGSVKTTLGQLEAAKILGAAEDISNEPTLEEVAEQFERLSGFKAALSDAVWLARYRTSHRYANKFGEGRSFIAGDAAHVHVPIGGQGMNTGIQDACNLGWKLAGVIKGIYQPSILKSYNEERHAVAESLIKGTDFAYHSILHPSELKQRAVKLLAPVLMHTEAAQNFVRNTLEEMHISYQSSSLNRDCGGNRGLRPGERAPDADLVSESEKINVSLYELYGQNEWTLLVFGGTGNPFDFEEHSEFLENIRKNYFEHISIRIVTCFEFDQNPRPTQKEVYFDLVRYAHDKFGVEKPAIYLVRPDGYIGFRSGLTANGVSALTDYLQGIFIN